MVAPPVVALLQTVHKSAPHLSAAALVAGAQMGAFLSMVLLCARKPIVLQHVLKGLVLIAYRLLSFLHRFAKPWKSSRSHKHKYCTIEWRAETKTPPLWWAVAEKDVVKTIGDLFDNRINRLESTLNGRMDTIETKVDNVSALQHVLCTSFFLSPLTEALNSKCVTTPFHQLKCEQIVRKNDFFFLARRRQASHTFETFEDELFKVSHTYTYTHAPQ